MKKIFLLTFFFLLFGFFMTYVRLTQKYSFDGFIKAQLIPVHTQVKGHVKNVMKKPGEFIQIGNPILEINRDVEFAHLEYAKALQKEEENKINRQKIKVDEATQLYIDAQTSSDTKLKEKTLQDLMTIQASYNATVAHFETINKKVELSKLNANRGLICAPIKGIIFKIFPIKGSYVKEDDVIGTVYDPESLWIETFVEQKDLKAILHRKKIQIELMDPPHTFLDAKIDSVISKGADQTAQIILYPMQKFSKKIRPEMPVKVWF